MDSVSKTEVRRRSRAAAPSSENGILEFTCPACTGEGKVHESLGEIACVICGGSGYARTELGRRVLDLVRNNFRVLI
jgi:DnaJ-class molecular chaperone